MPVGTAGAVKGITPEQLRQVGAEIILANTYHLMLRPGVDAIERAGGLHRFMGWDGPILTDSGGYQVFSLSQLTKIDDAGIEFASHVDGAKVYLDAQAATKMQNRLGCDIAMCLDQCPAFGCKQSELEKAVERTVRWAKRCKDVHANEKQMLFAIVQGGIDLAIREKCSAELVKMDFDGYAIGGLSVGEGHKNMVKTVRHTTPLLPEDKPRYLMGVGMPADIIAAVMAGVDMFDCVLPTRNARNAYAFTMAGPIRMRNNEHISDAGPIEKDCDCYACEHFSRAAIRHFFNVGEMLGPILTTIHNLRFYQRLMNEIRRHIERNDFAEWANQK
jgi:queuine tRNA-ribosyltransferase